MSDRFPIISGADPWTSPGRGERAHTTVVLVHGFTGNPCSLRPFGELLAARGFGVRVPRLPGHGTHWRDMLRTTYEDWRAEVSRAVTAARSDGSNVLLAGLSMGGTLSLDVASERSSELLGVAAINPLVLDREGIIARLAPLLEKLLPVVPAAAAGLVKNDIAKGGDERAYPMVPARPANSLLRQLPRIRESLRTLRLPALVAYAPQDHSVPAANARALLRMLPGPDVTEVVLPRSYHIATMDYDAELLAERLTAFIDRLTAPPPNAA